MKTIIVLLIATVVLTASGSAPRRAGAAATPARSRIPAYWVCGADAADVNGLYYTCDAINYALNGTCGTLAEKHFLFYDDRHLQWELYTYFGPLKKILTHYTAACPDTDVRPPQQPAAWQNVTAADGRGPSVSQYDDPKAITC